MKRLLVLLLLISTPLWGDTTAGGTFGYGSAAGGGSGSCASCSTSNDSSLYSDSTVGGTAGHVLCWLAFPFTVSSTQCITGGYFESWDAGGNTGATLEIYTDSAGDPGSRVGDGYTSTIANLPDTQTGDQEYAFAATQTLSAGNYWLVWKSADASTYYAWRSGTSTWKSSTNSGSSWTLQTGYIFRGGVNGCNP